ncbi:MAG: hypothetical protein K0R17_2706 [Rariglobus sp.]|jgi:hypothetical protein|nr:hypothetical protein [Rariglobus sp.]
MRLIRPCSCRWLVLCLFIAHAKADPALLIPDDWFTRVPTAERIKAVQAAAASDGWTPVAVRLFAGSIRAYELRQDDAASAWYLVARWCDLLGKPQSMAGRQWLETLGKAGGLHANIDQAQIAALPNEPIARLLTAETGAWLLGDRAFSETFFNLVTPYDCLPRVMAILQALLETDARRFATYTQLALAIALVYDAPPPSHWPHWQVSTKVLPRRLPPPGEIFKFLMDSDQAGATLHKLATLPAGDLKFVVDCSVGFPELIWAQRSVKFPLVNLVKSYEAIRYRNDRIEAQDYIWPGERYDLPTIHGEGGICVDQAYFATQAGKARGVPTLLFSGAGRDGRHAWFGYLGTGQKWVLDAGRYEEQRYVTGVTLDPQTWASLSDHELVFLSEGFRRLPPYRQSRQHQVFAELYLRLKQKPAAATAARKAVNYERRNVEAWELLVAASDEAPPRPREALLREAAQALQRYPDLNGRFVRDLATSLRERGEASAAEFEERSLVRRGQTGGRSDVGIDHAVTVMAGTAPADQVRVYRQLLQQYGRDTGIDFYDRVTAPLIEQMITAKRKGEALQVIFQTRAVLKPELGSQFDRELDELAAKAK